MCSHEQGWPAGSEDNRQCAVPPAENVCVLHCRCYQSLGRVIGGVFLSLVSASSAIGQIWQTNVSLQHIDSDRCWSLQAGPGQPALCRFANRSLAPRGSPAASWPPSSSAACAPRAPNTAAGTAFCCSPPASSSPSPASASPPAGQAGRVQLSKQTRTTRGLGHGQPGAATLGGEEATGPDR